MYKSEVEHQRYICHDQGDSNKNYFGELPAGMFHLPVMSTERFTPSGLDYARSSSSTASSTPSLPDSKVRPPWRYTV